MQKTHYKTKRTLEDYSLFVAKEQHVLETHATKKERIRSYRALCVPSVHTLPSVEADCECERTRVAYLHPRGGVVPLWGSKELP